MKVSDEFKIGIIAIASIAVLIFGYNLLRGNNIFVRELQLFAVYGDANGLNRTDPVIMHGLRLGSVDNIRLDYEGRTEPQIVVRFKVSRDARIPVNSIAVITSTDLLGGKAIEIIPGNRRQFVENRDTLSGQVELGISEQFTRVIAPLQQRTVSLITSLDSLVVLFNEVLGGDAKDDIEGSFRSIAQTLRNFERTSASVESIVSSEGEKLKRMMTHLENITGALSENRETFTNIMNNFSHISDSMAAVNFKQTFDRANDAVAEVESILERINAGDGNLGMLLHNEKLYRNVEDASNSLNRLLVDLRRNPHRYLNISLINFGRSAGEESQ